MLKYRCKACEIETSFSECPNCKKRTDLVESSVYWCEMCNVPVFDELCPVCGKEGKRVGTDARPVFPEERLLLEILMGCPMRYKEDSVWQISGSYYYVNGQRIPFSLRSYKEIDLENIRGQLEEYRKQNQNGAFQIYASHFIEANKNRYLYIANEAIQYIRDVSEGYRDTEIYVSFSGGKDSTVTSDLVLRGLGRQQVLHIYGDTTLEFPETKSYVERFKKANPRIPLVVAKNKDKDFCELCDTLGPPSRVMRWCCTIFKTGAIQRKIQSLFKNQKKVLTFYGIRRNESTSRSKYERESDSPKIAVQRTVSPIIDWTDLDIWLYLLTTGIDFNDAYRYGYTRVGCWCCPNNGIWSEFLSKIYMPEQYRKFQDTLLSFAKKIGKPDPEVYVSEGKWKARQGGEGLEYANNSVVSYEPCALQEDTFNYELKRAVSDELYEFFKPFGFINKELGNPRLGEVYITDKNGKLLLKLAGRIGKNTLKVTVLDRKAGHSQSITVVEEKVRCQLTKYQMCIGCLGCESACRYGAISIKTDHSGLLSYKVSDKKCVRCGHCITHYDNGCYLKKVVRLRLGT